MQDNDLAAAIAKGREVGVIGAEHRAEEFDGLVHEQLEFGGSHVRAVEADRRYVAAIARAPCFWKTPLTELEGKMLGVAELAVLSDEVKQTEDLLRMERRSCPGCGDDAI